MTSAEMLAKVYYLLGEGSGYFTDTEIYKSLTNGQIITASKLHLAKKFQLIQALSTTDSGSYGDYNLPSDFWQFRSAAYKYSGSVNYAPCLVRTGDKYIKEGNDYLAGTSTQPYVYLYNDAMDFDPAPTAGAAWSLEYYKIPTSISSVVEPILPDVTHDAICQYALADSLLRDSKSNEAVSAFDKYNYMVAQL